MHIAINAKPLNEELKVGVATYTLNLLKSLARVDLKNRYTIYGVRLAPKNLGIENNNFKIKNMPDFFRFWPSGYSYWYSWTFWYYTGFPVQLSLDKPDIFFSPYPSLPLCCPCSKVAVVHDLSFLTVRNSFRTHSQIILKNQRKV